MLSGHQSTETLSGGASVKSSTQLKALIRNLSKESLVGTEVLLRNFMLERLLERITLSKYKPDFILKGGMLIAAIVGIKTRSTMDMDITLKGKKLSKNNIAAILDEILKIDTNDSARFSLIHIEEIRPDGIYPGYRVHIAASFDKTRQSLKIDITTGDSITPEEIEYDFHLMFEDRKVTVFAYTLETILAEKFETILTRGVANTRMRDFYDVYILTKTQKIDNSIFQTALQNTVERRNSHSHIFSEIDKTITTLDNSEDMRILWLRYRRNYNYASNLSWTMMIDALHSLKNRLNL